MKFLCEQCKAKYQIADEKAAGKTVRMKCRKCGYLIEVRAAVTESNAPGPVGPAAPRPAAAPPVAAAKGTRPAAPRAAPLATSLAGAPKAPPARPADRPPGALAGAFKSTVQRDDETSAPFDMSDLSPGDEWYVAINGVPVGPIRMAEVRRKAALGAVTDDSLCWQEGLDEWRPVRSFPELSAIVREAATSGRTSLAPSTGEARTSHLPPTRPAGTRPSNAPAAPAGPATSHAPTAPQPPARSPARPAAPVQTAARSNVVPITSRLATAERLDNLIDDAPRAAPEAPPAPAPTPAPPEPAVVSDPFAMALAPSPTFSAAMTSAAVPAPGREASFSLQPPVLQRKGPPWMAIAMVAAATAFGITAAIAIFMRPAPAPTPVVVQVPGLPTAPATPTGSPSVAAAGTDTTTPDPSAAPTSAKGPVAMGGPRTAPATASATPGHGPLDLHGLGGTVAPTDDTANDGPKAPGQCFSSGQVQQVIGLHQAAIKRSCWERNPTTRPTVNVSVSLTIGPDGTPQNVSCSAEEPSVAKCVENDVRSWHFPQMGCTQNTAFSFHFVRQ